MKKQKPISRRCFLRHLGVLCVGIPFLLSEISCKKDVDRATFSGSAPESFDKYLTSLPRVTLDEASGIEGSLEVFKVASSAVIKGLNNRGSVTKIIFDKDTINLETVIVKILKSDNEYHYIIEDTMANQPIGRLGKGTILLVDAKNSINKLRDFNKAELESRFIIREK